MATRLERAIDWGTSLPDRVVSYHFIEAGTGTRSPAGWIISEGFRKSEKAQFKLAFELYASVADLRFVETAWSARADFRFASYREHGDTLGAMGPPGFRDVAGIGAFNTAGPGWSIDRAGHGGLAQGGFGFVTILHELGHGLGLAHPHDRGGSSTTFPGVDSEFDPGRFDLNQGVYTVMSYNDGWKTNPDGGPPNYRYGYEGTPMAIDIAVLQSKYGANNTYHKGDNTYRLPHANGEGTFYSCLWDAGGEDTIANRSNRPSAIDLRAATLRPEPGGGGFISHADGVFGGFTIAHRVTIERAEGGGSKDTITGNTGSNVIAGHGGADAVAGRGGNDRLRGDKGPDSLRGEGGDDILSGGAGRDLLFGGPGHDAFVFSSGAALRSVDRLPDFADGQDAILLSRGVFSGLGDPGPLAAEAFAVGEAASTALQRILYDPASGGLSHDRDGSGPAEAIRFARLPAGTDLDHRDIVVIA